MTTPTTALMTWTITFMNSLPVEGGYQDVVICAGWQCHGEEVIKGKLYVANQYGQCNFTFTGGSFTPYDQLTQDQVLNWCIASGLNQPEVEGWVQGQINSAANPPFVQLPLPWQA